MADRYNNDTFWETVHTKEDVETLARGEGIREIGGEDTFVGAAALYQLRKLAMTRLLRKAQLPPKPVLLELGSGGGFWVEYFSAQGAGGYIGTDISPTATERLASRFPGYAFQCLLPDDAWTKIRAMGNVDLSFAIDVLYHITEDTVWRSSLTNILASVKVGGFAIVSDYFYPEPRENPSTLHVKHRAMQDYLHVFEDCGFVIIDIQPVFYFLNRIKCGPFRDGNRVTSKIISAFAANKSGLKILTALDAMITKVLRPMSPRCKNRMVLLQRLR